MFAKSDFTSKYIEYFRTNNFHVENNKWKSIIRDLQRNKKSEDS